jgi:hypothetical protein
VKLAPVGVAILNLAKCPSVARVGSGITPSPERVVNRASLNYTRRGPLV